MAATVGLAAAAVAVEASPVAAVGTCGTGWTGLGHPGNVVYQGMYVGQVALEWNGCSGPSYGVRAHFQYATTFTQWYQANAAGVNLTADPVLDGIGNGYQGYNPQGPLTPLQTGDLYAPGSGGVYGEQANPGNSFQAKVVVWATTYYTAPPYSSRESCTATTDEWDFNNGTYLAWAATGYCP